MEDWLSWIRAYSSVICKGACRLVLTGRGRGRIEIVEGVDSLRFGVGPTAGNNWSRILTMTRHGLNNFDFVRLAAAGTVLYAHQFALNALPEPSPFGVMTLGTLGVLIFFSISGYLVAQSWVRDPSIIRFILKRILRVWPGLAVVACITVLVVGPLVTSLTLHDYFNDRGAWGYFSQLYLHMKYELPGVFERNFTNSVNGSLWTIPIEVRWYGVLLAAGIVGLLQRKWRFSLLLIVILYATYIYIIYDVQRNPSAEFMRPDFGCEYGTFFCYGALMSCMHDSWYRLRVPLLCVLSSLAALLFSIGYVYAAVYVLMPFLVVWFGLSSTPILRRAGRYGDYSYGIYIYAFLIQQIFISSNFKCSYWTGLFIVASCTLFCAVISWNFVELPAMNLKRHLSRIKGGAKEISEELDGGASLRIDA